MKRLHAIAAILAVFVYAGPVRSDDITIVQPANSILPWNRSFTVRDEKREDNLAVVSTLSSGVNIPASNKWGVTVNFDIKDTAYKNMDRMSAGAYFDISPRIRLGGSLSFSAPGDLRVSTPRNRLLPAVPGDNVPAVRIESSIKF